MSEQNQNRSSNNRSGGNGGNRNRNRNRSGGNRSGGNHNGGGGQGGGKGGKRNQNNRGGGGGGTAGQKRNELQPTRSRRPRKKPLTFWQKCLKAVGLYKEDQPAPAQGGNQRGPAKKAAKKSGRVAGGGRVDQNKGKGGNKQGGQGQKPRHDRKKAAPPTQVETPRLYVGNLSYDATEYDLEELFKGVGAVRKVELVYNRHTHKSKGYGFVNMANLEEAERAVEVLHDQPFMGRKMIVNGARSKGPNDKSPGGDNDAKTEAPQQDAAPAQQTSPADIPAQEEVHSLAPEKE